MHPSPLLGDEVLIPLTQLKRRRRFLGIGTEFLPCAVNLSLIYLTWLIAFVSFLGYCGYLRGSSIRESALEWSDYRLLPIDASVHLSHGGI